MSDRTRVSEHAEASAGAGDDATSTRADRVMGRKPGEGPAAAASEAGNGNARSTRPAGPPRSGSGSEAASSGSTSSSNGSEPTQRRRPSDGWGRASGASSAGRDGSGAEDETPTRVNPAVPTFRTPARESAKPAASGTTEPEGAAGVTDPPTTSTTTQTAVGTGSLGAVTKSMEEPAPRAEPEPTKPRSRVKPRKARRARLRLSRVDPWSVMKTSFLFSIALGIASWVAVAFVWWVIQQSGLFSAVNQVVSQVLQTPGDADPFRLEAYVNGSRVLGLTALLAVVDVILITALATVTSFLYNLSATMLGGLQVTLAETDD